MTGLHANTLREHLDGLQRVGLVAVAGAGHGARSPRVATRPPTAAGTTPPGYAGLAATLAAVIAGTSPRPGGRAGGGRVGQRLARGQEPVSEEPGPRGRRSPSSSTTWASRRAGRGRARLRLTRCPLLQAACTSSRASSARSTSASRGGVLAEYGAGTDGIGSSPSSSPAPACCGWRRRRTDRRVRRARAPAFEAEGVSALSHSGTFAPARCARCARRWWRGERPAVCGAPRE